MGVATPLHSVPESRAVSSPVQPTSFYAASSLEVPPSTPVQPFRVLAEPPPTRAEGSESGVMRRWVQDGHVIEVPQPPEPALLPCWRESSGQSNEQTMPKRPPPPLPPTPLVVPSTPATQVGPVVGTIVPAAATFDARNPPRPTGASSVVSSLGLSLTDSTGTTGLSTPAAFAAAGLGAATRVWRRPASFLWRQRARHGWLTTRRRLSESRRRCWSSGKSRRRWRRW